MIKSSLCWIVDGHLNKLEIQLSNNILRTVKFKLASQIKIDFTESIHYDAISSLKLHILNHYAQFQS